MQESQQNIQRYEEDEIDLRELFRTLMKNRVKIVLITSLITVGAIAYAYMVPKIYEVNSNVQVGHINQELIAEPQTLVKTLNLVFNVEDKVSAKEKFISEVSSISTNKNLKNFIEIKTQAISNEEALKKNKEVVKYIQDLYQPKIELYVINTKNSIADAQRDISNIENFEIKNIQRQIELLKTQRIVEIDAKIAKLLNQDIKKLEQQIELFKTQSIVEINKKIDFYKNIKSKAIESKIKFHVDKLKEYSDSINLLYKKNKLNDNTVNVVTSLQMVNYQNLILNSQNKIEDLKVEKEINENEIIANLEKEKKNILDVTIRDIELSIENIKNIDISNLEKEKKNINNETIRKLEHQINVDLVTKKIKLEEKINQLQYSIADTYIQNSKVIGEYIVKDYPIAPKKKLIVVVAFVTGLILSIFFVFFMEFIKGYKEEENSES